MLTLIMLGIIAFGASMEILLQSPRAIASLARGVSPIIIVTYPIPPRPNAFPMVHEPEFAMATLADGCMVKYSCNQGYRLINTAIMSVVARDNVSPVVLLHEGYRSYEVCPDHQCSLSDSPQTQRISNGARARVCYGNPRRWGAWLRL